MRIRKIKRGSSFVEVHYDREGKDGAWDEYSIKCTEAPRPELDQALARLAGHVGDICELPSAYVNGLRVTGLSLSYQDDTGNWGAVITALKALRKANSPLVINTPHLPSEPYSASNPSEPRLSGDQVRDIGTAMECAEHYVQGDRLQGQLKLGDQTAAPGPATRPHLGLGQPLVVHAPPRAGGGQADLKVTIDMDRKCKDCKKPGACDNGLCLNCTSKRVQGWKAPGSSKPSGRRPKLRTTRSAKVED